MQGMEIPQWLLGCSPLIFLCAMAMRESGDIGSAMKNIILPPVIFLALCLMLLDLWEWLS